MICAVNAAGNNIPPLFVFPRVNFKHFMLTGAPPGSIGAANPSGWSNETIFLQFFNHFIDHARPSVERPALLLMDNHETHITIPVIDLVKANGGTIMTFHPHTSHKMQPLDRGVFGPFKTFYNQTANNWMLTPGNAGKPITIYNVAQLAGDAYTRTVTPSNIIKGFKASRFVPLNENIFTENDFLPSAVTDRPMMQESEVANEVSSVMENVPSTSQVLNSPINPVNLPSTVLPEDVRPFPKAQPRKETQKGRPKGKSRILTDTPEKQLLEAAKRKTLLNTLKKQQKSL